MQKVSSPRKLIVLVGAGYANIEILKKHAQSPLRSCEILLINPRPTKFIRSMLPWVISGEVRRQNAEIDLLRLCKIAGAQLIISEIERVDLILKSVVLRGGGNIYFDYLSLSVGTEMKTPLQGPQTIYGNRLEFLLDNFDRLFSKATPPKLTVYGDSPLARLILRGLARLNADVDLTLITPGEDHLKDLGALEGFRFKSLLKSLRAEVLTGKTVQKNKDGRVFFSESESIETDLLILADEGSLSPIYERSGFPIEDGEVAVNDALQLTTCKQVFVSGPGVSIQGHLVSYNPNHPSHRFGKVIAENLKRELMGRPLIVFRSEHAVASWLPSPPELFSMKWSVMNASRWQKWLEKKKPKNPAAFAPTRVGEIARSSPEVSAEALVSAQMKIEGVEPFWVAQVLGRQILHQAQIKKLSPPRLLQGLLSLREETHPRKLLKSKLSQVLAGLQSLCPNAIEVRVTLGKEDSLAVSSDISFQPNTHLTPGDIILLVGKLGSVQSLFNIINSNAKGEVWHELRNTFNEDYGELIEAAISQGALGGCALDERGLARDLEDLVAPNNLGASFDLDRIPVHTVFNEMAVDSEAPHLKGNLECARYLPADLEALLHHPRFLALFGAELCGLLLILPRDDAKNITSELAVKFPKFSITPIGALTDGPVHFKFRLTTR